MVKYMYVGRVSTIYLFTGCPKNIHLDTILYQKNEKYGNGPFSVAYCIQLKLSIVDKKVPMIELMNVPVISNIFFPTGCSKKIDFNTNVYQKYEKYENATFSVAYCEQLKLSIVDKKVLMVELINVPVSSYICFPAKPTIYPYQYTIH